MKFVFFLNSASPHQIPYIRELNTCSFVSELFLVVPKIDSKERIKLGWNTEYLLMTSRIRYVLSASCEDVKNILNTSNTYCFFSGIRADSNVFRWFKFSLKFDVKRYLITEGPYTYNKPLFLHYIRFLLQDYKYIKYISGVFAIGDKAVKYYKSLSSSWKVYPFQYVTEEIKRNYFSNKGSLKLLYVGSFIKRKNVSFLLKSLTNISDVSLTLIGSGKNEGELKKIAKNNNLNVLFESNKSMGDIPLIMQQYDVLILPSLHDGWGAVVNEALSMGLFCLVSDKCGSSALIKNYFNGIIFPLKESSLVDAINYCKNNIDVLRNNVTNRIEDSKKINGYSTAKYFVNCILNENSSYRHS